MGMGQRRGGCTRSIIPLSTPNGYEAGLRLMKHDFKDALSLAGVLAGFAIAADAWRTLPPRIALHYNLAGRPDRYGSPHLLVLLPCATTCIWFLLTVVRRLPHLFHLPVAADDAMRGRVALVASEMIGSIAVLLTWSFALMTWSSAHATGNMGPTSLSMLLATFLLLLGTPLLLAFHFVRMRKAALETASQSKAG